MRYRDSSMSTRFSIGREVRALLSAQITIDVPGFRHELSLPSTLSEEMVDRKNMTVEKRAHNCRWAEPTLFEPAPDWADAEDRPWTCHRTGAPEPLESTTICEDCPLWERARTPENRWTVGSRLERLSGDQLRPFAPSLSACPAHNAEPCGSRSVVCRRRRDGCGVSQSLATELEKPTVTRL